MLLLLVLLLLKVLRSLNRSALSSVALPMVHPFVV